MDVSYDKPTPQANDNISVERAYIHHNFNDKWFTEVGLMNGQIWGTTFGDYLMPRWRVKFQGMTEYGAVGALYEKIAETGTFTVKDSEKDDYNAYALYGLTKLGDVTIEPLLYYHVDSAFYRSLSNGALVYSAQDKGSDGFKILYISLASRGKVGPLGMEAEFSYTKRDGEGITYTLQTGATTPPVTGSFDNDWVELGAYLNLWNDMDFGRVGAKMAYGSWDEDGGLFNPITQSYSGAGQDFREDFKSNLILGDEIGFGASTAEDLMGMTLIQPYIKGVKLGSDKLTCSASFGYIMSNQKDTAFEDASAWEGDLGVQYMLSPNLLYKVDAGYASIDYDEGDDPDPVMLLKHEIILTF
jgi:hypothetical protein